jgi:hypothetical protein
MKPKEEIPQIIEENVEEWTFSDFAKGNERWDRIK